MYVRMSRLTHQIPEIEMQIVATQASLHFYDQAKVDAAVQAEAAGQVDSNDQSIMAVDGDVRPSSGGVGVRVWKDEDEWSVCSPLTSTLSSAERQDWKQIGDPILHIELRRWADLVVVAPCSADFLAKLAAGFSDNLAVRRPFSCYGHADAAAIDDESSDAGRSGHHLPCDEYTHVPTSTDRRSPQDRAGEAEVYGQWATRSGGSGLRR